MKRRVIPAIFFLTLGISASAQELSLLVLGGRSSYGVFSFSPGSPGRGGDNKSWDSGPIVGLGIRVKATDTFFFGGTLEYSRHPYHSSEVVGAPTNTIFDLNAVARATFRIVGPVSGAFSFGLGYWSQKVDAVKWEGPNTVTHPGLSASGLGVLLGLGLATELTERCSLDLDGNLRFRTYVTPVVQLGVAYRVN